MGGHLSIRVHSGGFSLVELLCVLALLGICLAIGGVSVGHALAIREAKGAAQAWQAAAAWAQSGVVWQGGGTELQYEAAGLSLEHSAVLCGGNIGGAAPVAAVTTNLPRWRLTQGVIVRFGGDLGSPDGGGSLYFGDSGRQYRVVVRPESGLTVRSISEDGR